MLMVSLLMVIGCYSEEEEGTTTIFEGVVVYEDDITPVRVAH